MIDNFLLGSGQRHTPSPSQSNENRSRGSDSGNDNAADDVEEINTDNKPGSSLPVPNFNIPGFPPGFAQNLPVSLPNFDPSNLPQGVRELAMLQHQQLAQVSSKLFAL
jgi:hypothetical protein